MQVKNKKTNKPPPQPHKKTPPNSKKGIESVVSAASMKSLEYFHFFCF